MITSMTGYANSAENYGLFDIDIEIKSVNHRYLNIFFKLPDELRFLEQKMTSVIAGFLSRGKVECRVFLNKHANNNQINLNLALTNELVELNKKLMRESNLNSLAVGDLLKFPGILTNQETDWSEIETQIIKQLEQTCLNLNEARKREGTSLQKYLLERISQVNEIVQHILSTYPSQVKQYTTALTEKINATLQTQIDPERLNQELALYIQKMDIDEELSRLQAHIQEARRLLEDKQKIPAGKRLDFMMQEFNRETNTIASKSNDTALTQATIELKVLIEQMREQIQNIE